MRGACGRRQFRALLPSCPSAAGPAPLPSPPLALGRRPQVPASAGCAPDQRYRAGITMRTDFPHPATINTALEFDNEETFQKIIVFAVKGRAQNRGNFSPQSACATIPATFISNLIIKHCNLSFTCVRGCTRERCVQCLSENPEKGFVGSGKENREGGGG